MKIAIDYDTVVATDARLYSQMVAQLVGSKHVVVLTTTPHSAAEADEWAYHAGVREVYVLGPGKQMQDVLSADVWYHGRVDRVVGREQILHLYEKVTKSSRPDDYC